MLALPVEHCAVSTELLLQDRHNLHRNSERRGDLRTQRLDFLGMRLPVGDKIEIVRWLELLTCEMKFGQSFDSVAPRPPLTIRNEIPDARLGNQPQGPKLARALGALARGVGGPNHLPLHDRITQQLQTFRRFARMLAPCGVVVVNRRGKAFGFVAHRFRQCTNQFLRGEARLRRGESSSTQQPEHGSRLIHRKPGQVGAGVTDELPPSAATRLHIEGHARRRQRFEVTSGRRQ